MVCNAVTPRNGKVIKRLFVATAVLAPLLACSPTARWQGSTGGGLESARSATTINSTLLSQSESPLGIDFQKSGSEEDLVLNLQAPANGAFEVTRLEQPARLVIDLFGVNGPKATTVTPTDSAFINQVRVGNHPDKSRIVLDLIEDTTLRHQVTETGKQITISLNGSTSVAAKSGTMAVATNDSETSAPAVSETAKTLSAKPQVFEDKVIASKSSLDSSEVRAKPSFEPVNETAVEAAPVEEEIQEAPPARKVVAKQKTIESYEFQSIGIGENALIVQGEGLGSYTFKRSAPSEYVLRMPGVDLSATALEPAIAPADSGAIRSVRSKKDGDLAEVRIFTSPQYDLVAQANSSGIVVTSNTSVNLKDARAQAKVVEPAKIEELKADKDSALKDTTLPPEAEVSKLLGEQPRYNGRLISLDLQDTDIDNALRIIAEVSNLNIIASEDVTGKITLRLIDVPWDQALDVILKTNGLDKVQEGNVIRIAPVEKLRQERESLKQARQAEEELEALQVRYVRVSYAKASELKALVESVLSERGSVAYDERTNQLIIKDIRSGVVNTAELIAKLDLRTPQVLLETQIVEASRRLLRELGSEVGFNFVQSPATGNATGYNFPNSIGLGGSVTGGTSGSAVSFPSAGDVSGGSAISLLLDSADATKSLTARLSALESEGRARIISRPAVATTNNKQATIKSVEKIRIKQPSGGLSVATGQGASASGTGSATETIEIGIVLEVTPQASPDYYVLLDINAKSSTLGSTIVDGIPSEVERSATSSVLVSSGQTFAMGGIYKITDNDSVDGVPFLKDIPFLGHLFRRSRVNNSDEELLFFITPRVIEGSFDDAAMKL